MINVSAVPRSDRLVTLRDGRSLAYAEWGDAGGRPLVLIHGRPGSRLLCPDADATESAGVRLITVDRPGYGRSDPTPDPSYLHWADDFAELHGLLGLPSCPIVGWSAGGPFALAFAVRRPDLTSTVGLIASVGPLVEIPAARDELTPEVRRIIDLYHQDPAAAMEAITRRFAWYADEPTSIFDGFGPPGGPDEDLLTQPNIREAMNQAMREGARQGLAGLVSDWILDSVPWGFDVADVTQEVGIWCGALDDRDIRLAADYFAATIPRASLVMYPDAGHLLGIPHWAEMLAWLH